MDDLFLSRCARFTYSPEARGVLDARDEVLSHVHDDYPLLEAPRGAASPTPDAAYVVSIMSRPGRRTRRLTLGTARALLNRIGLEYVTIYNYAISICRQPVQTLHHLGQLLL